MSDNFNSMDRDLYMSHELPGLFECENFADADAEFGESDTAINAGVKKWKGFEVVSANIDEVNAMIVDVDNESTPSPENPNGDNFEPLLAKEVWNRYKNMRLGRYCLRILDNQAKGTGNQQHVRLLVANGFAKDTDDGNDIVFSADIKIAKLGSADWHRVVLLTDNNGNYNDAVSLHYVCLDDEIRWYRQSNQTDYIGSFGENNKWFRMQIIIKSDGNIYISDGVRTKLVEQKQQVYSAFAGIKFVSQSNASTRFLIYLNNIVFTKNNLSDTAIIAKQESKDEEVYEIVDYFYKEKKYIRIPQSYNKKPIVGIYSKFYGDTNNENDIESIIIDSNITKSYSNIFSNALSLSHIWVPWNKGEFDEEMCSGGDWGAVNATVYYGVPLSQYQLDYQWDEEYERYTCRGVSDNSVLRATILSEYDDGTNGRGTVNRITGTTGWQSVKFLSIPKTITTIATNAFAGCSGTTFYFEGHTNDYDKALLDGMCYGADDDSCNIVFQYPVDYIIDSDYLGFSFNGKHSIYDLKVYRTSENGRYNDNLSPTLQDIMTETPGVDGAYYFGTRHGIRTFNINFAFEDLTESDLREWKRFCAGKEMGDLIFDEVPYKVYTAKITGTPMMKTLCFNGPNGRIYKGEGTLQFTAYLPYAHTPDKDTKISFKTHANGKFGKDGRKMASYSAYTYLTKNQWVENSGLLAEDYYTQAGTGENPGDLPAPFVVSFPDDVEISAGEELTVGDLSIEMVSNYTGVQWDSKTGIVSALITLPGGETERQPIPYEGKSLGAIPVGGCHVDLPDEATLSYHYWYY